MASAKKNTTPRRPSWLAGLGQWLCWAAGLTVALLIFWHLAVPRLVEVGLRSWIRDQGWDGEVVIGSLSPTLVTVPQGEVKGPGWTGQAQRLEIELNPLAWSVREIRGGVVTRLDVDTLLRDTQLAPNLGEPGRIIPAVELPVQGVELAEWQLELVRGSEQLLQVAGPVGLQRQADGRYQLTLRLQSPPAEGEAPAVLLSSRVVADLAGASGAADMAVTVQEPWTMLQTVWPDAARWLPETLEPRVQEVAGEARVEWRDGRLGEWAATGTAHEIRPGLMLLAEVPTLAWGARGRGLAVEQATVAGQLDIAGPPMALEEGSFAGSWSPASGVEAEMHAKQLRIPAIDPVLLARVAGRARWLPEVPNAVLELSLVDVVAAELAWAPIQVRVEGSPEAVRFRVPEVRTAADGLVAVEDIVGQASKAAEPAGAWDFLGTAEATVDASMPTKVPQAPWPFAIDYSGRLTPSGLIAQVNGRWLGEALALATEDGRLAGPGTLTWSATSGPAGTGAQLRADLSAGKLELPPMTFDVRPTQLEVQIPLQSTEAMAERLRQRPEFPAEWLDLFRELRGRVRVEGQRLRDATAGITLGRFAFELGPTPEAWSGQFTATELRLQSLRTSELKAKVEWSKPTMTMDGTGYFARDGLPFSFRNELTWQGEDLAVKSDIDMPPAALRQSYLFEDMLGEAAAGISLSGELSFHGEVNVSDKASQSAGLLRLSKGEIVFEEQGFAAREVEVEGRFTDLLSPTTEPGQTLRFKTAVMGIVTARDFVGAWQLREGRYLDVAEAKAELLGGTFRIPAFTVDGLDPVWRLAIEMNNIDALELTRLFPDFPVEVEGRLDGQIPVRWSTSPDGRQKVVVSPSTLRLRPGSGGLVRFKQENWLTREMEESDIRYSTFRRLEQATRQMNLTSLAIHLYQPDQPSAIVLEISGEPVGVEDAQLRRLKSLVIDYRINADLAELMSSGAMLSGGGGR